MKPITNKLTHTLDAREVQMHAVLIEVVPGSILSKASRPSVSRSCPQSARYVGFQSGTWLTGGVDGKGLSLTLWNSEENARGMAERFGPGSSPSASIVRFELREVAATR